MAKKDVLGRGYENILADNMLEDSSEVTRLRINQIQPRPDQPRSAFNQESLSDLAESIAAHGVIQPLLVRKGVGEFYEIIAGERRWRASKMAGLSEVPVVVVDADELKAAQLALIENIQREDLNPIEEAMAYEALLRNYGMKQEDAARQLGKSRSGIANHIRILELPKEVLDMVRVGDLSASHARTLLGLSDKEKIVPLAQRIINRKLSVREAEAAVRRENDASSRLAEEPEITGVQVDYYAEVERKVLNASGIRVRLRKVRGKTRLELDCADNDELEEVIKRLCGDAYRVD